FHSRLMQPANEEFAKHLDAVTITEAYRPIYANVTAAPVTQGEEVKQLLLNKLYSPVRVEQSSENMLIEDMDEFVEVGTGKVLCGLVRKINRKTKTFAIQDVASFEKFLEWYREEA